LTMTPRPLPQILTELGEALRLLSNDHDWFAIGYPKRPGGRALRLVCPEPPPPPQEGSNADLIMTVLSEADRPLTVVEIAFRATAGEPTGAMRKALYRLVRDGVVRELNGPPKTYEAV
jgi:hypothetical protein